MGTNVNNYSPVKSQQGCVPPEGPSAQTVDLDFTNATGSQNIDLDLQPVQSTGQWSWCECIFFDNSANATPITVFVFGSNQTFTFPPQACGYIPVQAINAGKFRFTSTGNVVVRIVCLNYYMPPFVWSAVSVKGT